MLTILFDTLLRGITFFLVLWCHQVREHGLICRLGPPDTWLRDSYLYWLGLVSLLAGWDLIGLFGRMAVLVGSKRMLRLTFGYFRCFHCGWSRWRRGNAYHQMEFSLFWYLHSIRGQFRQLQIWFCCLLSQFLKILHGPSILNFLSWSLASIS